jgi:hypothetical protein
MPLLFHLDLIKKIHAGDKTETRRDWSRPRVKVGREYLIKNQMLSKTNFGKVRILNLRQEPLGAIRPVDAAREGFEDVAEFKEYWTKINGPKSWTPAKRIYVVRFEFVQGSWSGDSL